MNRLLSALFSFQLLAGNRRLFLLCLLLFCISGLLSFGWFFPAEVVQRRLVQTVSKQAGLQMQGSNASMLFPIGLKFDLHIEPQLEELADIKLDGLEITPAWSSLLSGQPAVSLEGLLAQGDIHIMAEQNGLVDLTVQGINVSALQLPGNDYLLSGRLNGHLKSDNVSAGVRGRGDFAAELIDSTIGGLQKVGLPAEFSLGRVNLIGKFNQRRVSIEQIVATEGVLELSGGGTLLVGDTPEKTRLNLNIRLHPRESTPESLRSMIQLTGVRPTADGSYLLRIGGTMAKPFIR